MAFPSVAASATGRTTGNATSHPVTLPAGVTAGDLLIVVFSNDGIATVSVTSGTGWTKLGQTSDSASTVSGSVFYKVATGSDALTLGTGSTEESSHISLRITGASGVVTGSSSQSGVSASSNSNPPSHTPGGGAQDYLWIATRSGDSTVVATAAPANYGNLLTQAANTTGGASSNTAERQLNASSEDPGTFTSASENWICWTLAIAPAPPAAPIVIRRPMGALMQL